MKTIAAAAAAVALSGGMAAAAVATTDLNVRSGPGTEHRVIGVIPAGASVRVVDCQGSWCRVMVSGRSGFASASYLADEGGVAAPVVRLAPGYGYDDDYGYYGGYDGPYGYGYGSYGYGPSVGFGLSFGSRGWSGGHRHWSRGYRGDGPRWSGRGSRGFHAGVGRDGRTGMTRGGPRMSQGMAPRSPAAGAGPRAAMGSGGTVGMGTRGGGHGGGFGGGHGGGHGGGGHRR